MENKITAYCRIRKGTVSCNGSLIYANTEEQDHVQFLNQAYRFFKPEYPKFFKMDPLSKLAFLATHLLLRDRVFGSESYLDTAVILNNSAASVAVDRQYQRSTEDFPAPSLFVYTLPNVMVGEICIRYKIFGENIVFVTEKFDPQQLEKMIHAIDLEGNTSRYITGYVDEDGCEGDAFILLVEKNTEGLPFTVETLKSLYI